MMTYYHYLLVLQRKWTYDIGDNVCDDWILLRDERDKVRNELGNVLSRVFYTGCSIKGSVCHDMVLFKPFDDGVFVTICYYLNPSMTELLSICL